MDTRLVGISLPETIKYNNVLRSLDRLRRLHKRELHTSRYYIYEGNHAEAVEHTLEAARIRSRIQNLKGVTQ